MWNIARFDKLPVGYVCGLQPKIIADRRRNIQSGAAVCIRFGSLISENVLKIICSERTTILPLRVTNPVAFANGDPMILAKGLARRSMGLSKPWNEKKSLRRQKRNQRDVSS